MRPFEEIAMAHPLCIEDEVESARHSTLLQDTSTPELQAALAAGLL